MRIKLALQSLKALQIKAHSHTPELFIFNKEKGYKAIKMLSDSEVNHLKIDFSDVIEDIVVEYNPKVDIGDKIFEINYKVKLYPYDKSKLYFAKRDFEGSNTSSSDPVI